MIKFIVFDFDGVFTDGKFYFNETGITSKCYNAKDALALKILKDNNILTGVITNDKIVSIKDAKHIFNRLDKYSLGDDRPKLEILDSWLSELNLTYQDVAYMGDDLADIPILKEVGMSGCPNDALECVKEICKQNNGYLCIKNGGEGAVREFVDIVLSETNKEELQIINQEGDGKITAVIPVRKGSTRCKNKNIRNFGDTNLLKLKIETLKKVKGIDNILVSSNCDKMLNIAKQLGVNIHKREEEYCTNENPGRFFCNLANNISTSILMHTPITSPFISIKTYNDIIEKWNNIKETNDSLNTVCCCKEFLWYKNKTINYDRSNPPPSQNLPEYNYLNFGCNIIYKNSILNCNNIVGNNPEFFELDNISSIDIDNNDDFIVSELLYNSNITNDKICKQILENRIKKPELIDCTIRDGGYLNNWNFSDQEVLDCYKAVSKCDFSYFEVGFRSNDKLLPGKGKWCYCQEDDINHLASQFKGAKICVMAKMGTVTIDDFIEKKLSNVDLVRVLVPRCNIIDSEKISEYCEKDLIDARDFSIKLINLGYEVCINLGCGDLITDKELNLIIKHLHDLKIKSLYLADTYGGFNCMNIPKVLHRFYNELDKYNSKISLGFHIHNNNGDGLNKAQTAIFHGCSMIDSSIGGLGRGSGNLKTEEFVCSELVHVDTNFKEKITAVIEYFDKYILSKEEYNLQKIKLHHPLYNIAGTLSLHPDYILELLENLDNTITEDIDMIFKLNDYTVKNNCRNYDKNLIKKLS